ncbi:MAG: cytochrome C oxidase subunit IV family protein [Chloroflexota bacterium]|nr:MAG: cytochrome C oxidase subunit IV family protein [Chloroflexota bacterium]
MEENKKAENRRNIIVFVVLAILTAVEFWLALNLDDATVPLLIVALVKAALIVQFFMHIYRLRREEDHS